MLNDSNKPRRSMDGFIPSSNAPRRVGFDITPPKKSAAQFPVVGQTLSAYRPTATPSQAQRRPQPMITPSPFNLDFDDEATPARSAKKAKSKRRFFSWKRIVALFLLLILGIGGWLGFKFVYNASKTFHGGVLGILTSTRLQGEDVGRVNILLAGNSSDDPGHDGANLTDSIMVISINTKDNSAFMMSVPRDLWVEIPGFGHAKINEAYVDGQSENFHESGYFPKGMGLLQKTVQENFNLDLNYYALIDYNALHDMVNAVGGIDFTVKSSDKRGLYDPSKDWTTKPPSPLVKLTNGVHHLDGRQALDLARARGDAYGSYGFPAADFDRTNNQRQELMVLKDKVTTTGVLANPAKLSSLMDAIGNNVKTNMSLSEVHRLYDISKTTTSVQSVGLNNAKGKNLLASYAAPTGQSALIPAAGLDDFTAIQSYLKQLMSSDPVSREGASVVVLNATDTSGIAAHAAKVLTGKNITVAATDDAKANQASTTIIDASAGKMPATKQLLMSLYGSTVTTTNPYVNVYDADFIIILGQNQVPKTTTTTTH